MKFAAVIVSLMGLTAINAAAVPQPEYHQIETRQISGIISSITATISSLQDTLETATGGAADTIQSLIDGLQDTLDALLGSL
ncbi:hypothetical protein AC579_6694 [Pseudocercospora musae]|uniref:Uncharacterized protein n=1 Tax=Pseudocercospora musae TaxID=113226 RepID=A0A139HZX5_9PEZI|nr:hypothetical protein AC579_6694 [Pseudocercospora musae]